MTKSKKLLNETFTRSMASFVVRVMGVGFVFLFNMYIAREYGAEQAGVFLLGLTVATVSCALAKLGMDNVVLKHVAAGLAVSDWNEANGIIKLAVIVVVVCSAAIGVGMYFLSNYMAVNIFNDERLEGVFKVFSFFIPAFSLLTVFSEALKGLGKVAYSQFFYVAMIPMLALMVASLSDEKDIEHLSLLYLILTLATLIGAVLVWCNTACRHGGIGVSCFQPRNALMTAYPLYIVAILAVVIDWNAVIYLGIFESVTEVAIFQICMKIALLVNFILVAVNSVVAPKISMLYRQDKIDDLRRLSQQSSTIVTLIVLPLVMFLVLLPEFVLSFFGDEFVIGAPILQLLVVGQLINVSTGGVGYLLMMTGNESGSRDLAIVFALISIVLNYFLVTLYGVIGLALGVALVMSLINISAMFLVKRKLGFYVWKFL